jgi:hypothetical protein
VKNPRSSLTVAAAVATLTAAAALTATVLTAGTVAAAQPKQRMAAQTRTHSMPVSVNEFATASARIAAQVASRKPAAASRIAHLDPSLNQLAGVSGASALSAAPVSAKGTIDVRVTGPAATAAAVAAGGRVIARVPGSITVAIRPAKLRALAASAGVTEVARTIRAQPQAQVISEGVLASGAQNWAQHGNLGNGGAGIKVAIVDAGFGNLQTEIADGNFNDPDGNPVTVVYDNTLTDPDPNATDHCADDSATDHGTGVAEIVHQMAPRATLYLYCVDDDQGFSQSASQVVAAGIKIATSSLGFIADSRGDGTGAAGTTEAAVKTAHDAGVFWIQSAGNSAQDHWSGKLVDANNDSHVDLLNTADEGEGDIVDLDPHTPSQPAASGSIVLSWDQWPTSSLPITLAYQEFNSAGNPIGQPVSVTHAAGADPTLDLPIVNNSMIGGDFHQYLIYVLVESSSPTVRYDLTYSGDVYASYLSSLAPGRAAAGSVTEPATSPAAVAVGAANWHTDVLEQFSSRGPTIDNRVKPDLLAFDGVSSNLTDLEASDGTDVGFYGTSAAAPHVAGAAALALANDAQLNTPASLLAFLQGRTSPHVEPATNDAGSGVLQLLDLANPATPTCPARTTVPARITIDRPDVTFTAPITTTCTKYHVVSALQGAGGVFDTLYWTAASTSDVGHFNPRVSPPGTYSTKLVNGVSGVGGVAWTSATTTLKYSTQDYIASSRKGAAVYINGLFKNYSNSAAGLARGAGRTVYLQRYLNGAWQTMLSRTTLADGTMAVGFIQNTVYQYRLVTLESATIWSGNSTSTFR